MNRFVKKIKLFLVIYFLLSCIFNIHSSYDAMAEDEKKSGSKVIDDKKAIDKAESKAESKVAQLTEDAILELEEKTKQISEKEKLLDERERAIEIQENILQGKLKRIEEISKKMAAKLDKFKEESEIKVSKLVTMLETMKPDAAAAYIESVDPFLAVEVLSRINVQKAAKIMNKVDKKISARLSELFTGFKSKIDKYDEAEVKPKG